METYRIGIDVGGTNTDAVIIDQQQKVVAAVKCPTTIDVQSGIIHALEKVLTQSEVDPSLIKHVMLGTTHATNAIIEKKQLARTAVVRICLPVAQSIPPMFTWNEDLRKAIGGHYTLIHGGCEFDGRPLQRKTLDLEECNRVLDHIEEEKFESVAVTAVFSPTNDNHERAFAKIVQERFGEDFPVSLSSEIGKIGFLERENSTILNAALVKVTGKIATSLEYALERYDIDANIYVTQNDGTLMSLEAAKRYPILTIGSGPANSIRGAAYLSKLSECVVCDIGGTTSDIGILKNGFPRESAMPVEIEGVRTNFRMPDIISIGIGGGSIVREKDGVVTVGPDSVGYGITHEAVAFGGHILTATDCLLALGLATIDHPNCDPGRLWHIEKELCEKTLAIILEKIEIAIDKIKTSKEKLPLILVGGGSILLQGEPEGVSPIILPEYAGCANAIGAAIGHVSGEVDKLISFEKLGRDRALDEVKKQAIARAVEAGADPDTVSIIDLDEIPLAYMPSNIVRVKAKAAGELLRVYQPI